MSGVTFHFKLFESFQDGPFDMGRFLFLQTLHLNMVKNIFHFLCHVTIVLKARHEESIVMIINVTERLGKVELA